MLRHAVLVASGWKATTGRVAPGIPVIGAAQAWWKKRLSSFTPDAAPARQA